jgi:hypothetical protein
MKGEPSEVSIAYAVEESHEEEGVTVITRARLLWVSTCVVPRQPRRSRLRRWLARCWQAIAGYFRKAVKRG